MSISLLQQHLSIGLSFPRLSPPLPPQAPVSVAMSSLLLRDPLSALSSFTSAGWSRVLGQQKSRDLRRLCHLLCPICPASPKDTGQAIMQCIPPSASTAQGQSWPQSIIAMSFLQLYNTVSDLEIVF